MKTRARKAKHYPRITLRIDPDLLIRVDSVRNISNLSYGQIVSQGLRRYLPELEKFHKRAA